MYNTPLSCFVDRALNTTTGSCLQLLMQSTTTYL